MTALISISQIGEKDLKTNRKKVCSTDSDDGLIADKGMQKRPLPA